MKQSFSRFALLALTVAAVPALGTSALAGGDAWQHAGVLSSVVKVSTDGVTLNQDGAEAPIVATVTPATQVGGICEDCGMFMTFGSTQCTGTCKMCSCSDKNGTCVSWAHLKDVTWQNMLKALPVGTGLRTVFNTPGNPASGLKDIYINRREVLLPVTGLAGKTTPELTKLTSSVGAASAELTGNGTLLKIELKQDWTAKKEAQLVTILGKVGGNVNLPTAVASAK